MGWGRGRPSSSKTLFTKTQPPVPPPPPLQVEARARCRAWSLFNSPAVCLFATISVQNCRFVGEWVGGWLCVIYLCLYIFLCIYLRFSLILSIFICIEAFIFELNCYKKVILYFYIIWPNKACFISFYFTQR